MAVTIIPRIATLDPQGTVPRLYRFSLDDGSGWTWPSLEDLREWAQTLETPENAAKAMIMRWDQANGIANPSVIINRPWTMNHYAGTVAGIYTLGTAVP